MAPVEQHGLPERPALDAVSADGGRMLYSLFTPAMRRQVVFGGSDVTAWRA